MAILNDRQTLPGQMDIWECIEVAESGSDGKPTTSPGTDAKQDVPTETRSGDPSDAWVRHPAPTQRLSVSEVVKRRLEE